MYNKIRNPETGRKINIFSKKGKQILKKYLNVMLTGGGGDLDEGIIEDGNLYCNIVLEKKTNLLKLFKKGFYCHRYTGDETNEKSGNSKQIKYDNNLMWDDINIKNTAGFLKTGIDTVRADEYDSSGTCNLLCFVLTYIWCSLGIKSIEDFTDTEIAFLIFLGYAESRKKMIDTCSDKTCKKDYDGEGTGEILNTKKGQCGNWPAILKGLTYLVCMERAAESYITLSTSTYTIHDTKTRILHTFPIYIKIDIFTYLMDNNFSIILGDWYISKNKTIYSVNTTPPPSPTSLVRCFIVKTTSGIDLGSLEGDLENFLKNTVGLSTIIGNCKNFKELDFPSTNKDCQGKSWGIIEDFQLPMKLMYHATGEVVRTVEPPQQFTDECGNIFTCEDSTAIDEDGFKLDLSGDCAPVRDDCSSYCGNTLCDDLSEDDEWV